MTESDEEKTNREMLDAIQVAMMSAANSAVAAERLMFAAGLILIGNLVLAAVVIAGWYR